MTDDNALRVRRIEYPKNLAERIIWNLQGFESDPAHNQFAAGMKQMLDDLLPYALEEITAASVHAPIEGLDEAIAMLERTTRSTEWKEEDLPKVWAIIRAANAYRLQMEELTTHTLHTTFQTRQRGWRLVLASIQDALFPSKRPHGNVFAQPVTFSMEIYAPKGSKVYLKRQSLLTIDIKEQH